MRQAAPFPSRPLLGHAVCARFVRDYFVASRLKRNPDTGFASSVIPAQAGIEPHEVAPVYWIPACAGMTDGACARGTTPVSPRAGLPDGQCGTHNDPSSTVGCSGRMLSY